MPRRTAQPPYEIMTGGNAAPTDPSVHRRRRGGRGGRSWSFPDASAVLERVRDFGSGIVERLADFYASFKPAGQSTSPWWIGSTKPVVLRMSRGLVVGSIAGGVALVLLAFWIGMGQGQQTTGRSLATTDPAGNSPWSAPAGADIPGGAETTVGPIPRIEKKAAEPRVPGMNYLVYSLTDETEAQRLQAFLAEQDVETLVVPTRHRVAIDGDSGQDTVLHLVVDVTRGFSREQYLRGEHHKFLNERMQFGQAWHRHNGNRGSALESMTFYKYEPQDLPR